MAQRHAGSVVPSRRLDDRIRDLCAEIVKTPRDVPESVLKELQSALRQKVDRIRALAASKFLSGPNISGENIIKDRRSSSNESGGSSKAS